MNDLAQLFSQLFSNAKYKMENAKRKRQQDKLIVASINIQVKLGGQLRA